VHVTNGSSAVRPAGQLNMFNASTKTEKMAALSRAEVFFERPVARADAKTEKPSLYNPYWLVRLVAPTAADRVWAAAQQGGVAQP